MQNNPFHGFTDMISEMARMRELGRTGYDPNREHSERTYATAWVPTADIFSRRDDLVIRVELAGVREQDIEVSLSGGILTVSGDRKSEIEEDEVTFYSRERFYGVFRRSMNLPEGINEQDVEAEFDAGVLEVVVRGAFSSAQTREPRRIRIGEKSSGS